MKERLEKLESGEMSRKNKDEECGITHPMLFDSIEPEDYVCPVLHAVDLLPNKILKYAETWFWYRVEDNPIELIVARINWAAAATKKTEADNKYLEAERHKAEMQEELEALEEDDIADDDPDYIWQKELLSAASADLEAAKNQCDNTDKHFRECRKAKDKLEKDNTKYGQVTRDFWMKLQHMMKHEFKVWVSVYHGGELEGNQARVFCRKAPEIMARMKQMTLEFLSTLSENERRERADEKELDLYLGAFQRLLQYIDMLSHYCYQEYGSMTDSDVQDAKRCIDYATRLWQKVMPTIPMKVHAWRHLAEDLEKYRGMKSHHEQEIERAHQRGLKDERRLCCVADYQKKINSVLSHKATADSTPVKEMRDDTEEKMIRRKRKKV